MGWIMKHGNNNYSVAAEQMVDISDSFTKKASGGSRYAGGGKNKTKIAVIICIAVAVVAAVAVAGFMLFSHLDKQNETKPQESAAKEFVFSEKTAVSGLDISGKTIKEAKALLEKNQTSFITPVKFSVNVDGNSEELTQSDFEYTFNIDEVLGQVKADSEAKRSSANIDYTVKATVTEESVSKNVKAICEKYDASPVDAHVTKFNPYSENRFEFAEAQSGLDVSSDDLKQQFNQAFNSGQNYCAIEAKTETLNADVSVDFLKKNLVKLASYETVSTNTENGTTNMRVSLEACNGSIIDPDEVWSFNDCTGDSNLESNGYKSAHVISEGKIIDGIGGGICQSSSTIYNAAIRSNMEVVERYNHKWASVYVPTGLDATIDYPNLDLKLRNTTKYQMFLECKVVDYTLYASFWGYQDPSYDSIKTRNELGDSSGSGYSVKAWRVYYKGGKQVNEEELPSSYYDSDNGVVFYTAENDSGDTDTNVDNVNDSYSSSDTAEAAPAANYAEPVYDTPVTETATEPVSVLVPDSQAEPSAEIPEAPSYEANPNPETP